MTGTKQTTAAAARNDKAGRFTTDGLVLAIMIAVTVAAVTPVFAGRFVYESSLLGYWTFDETGGSIAYDATDNTFNGTVSGATAGVAGKYGTAYSFDGASASVAVADDAAFDGAGVARNAGTEYVSFADGSAYVQDDSQDWSTYRTTSGDRGYSIDVIDRNGNVATGYAGPSSGTQALGADVMINGSCEAISGGWTADGCKSQARSNEQKKDGSYSWKVETSDTANYTGVRNTFPVDDGALYYVHGWHRKASGGTYVWINQSDGGRLGGGGAGVNYWYERDGVVTTDEGQATAWIRPNAYKQVTFYVDAFSAQPVLSGSNAIRMYDAVSGGSQNFASIDSGFSPRTTAEYVISPVTSTGEGTLDQLTIAGWIKPTSVATASDLMIAGKRDGSDGYGLYQYQDDIYFRFGGRYARATGVLVDDTWAHVAATFDGLTATVYVDGVLSSSVGYGGLVQTSTDFSFGSDGSAFFDGVLDDFGMWNRALSVDDIAAVYTDGIDAYSTVFIPEPATLSLVLIGGLMLTRIHRARRAKKTR